MKFFATHHWYYVFAVFAIIEFVHSSDTSTRRTEDAQMYFIEGHMSQQEGQLKEALPFYRAALRLVPNSVEYLSLIGNIEYLLGLYESALKRFKKILSLDSDSVSSAQLATAKYYVTLTSKKLRIVDPCVSGDCSDGEDDVDYIAIPELPLSVLIDCKSKEGCDGFPSFFDHQTHPFILRGALQYLNTDLTMFTPESLNESYSNHNVDFYPQNMLTKPNKVYTVPFHKALGYLAYPEGAYLSVDASEQGTYIQWNMNETVWDDILTRSNLLHSLPDIFSHSMNSVLPTQSIMYDVSGFGDVTNREETLNNIKHRFGRKTHWYMLLVGEEGSGMFPHQDTLSVGSWQAQVQGSKRWRICTPSSLALRPSEDDGIEVQIEEEDPQNENQLDICYESILKIGDLVYYPPFYWHETLNLESPTVALSGTVVAPSAQQALISMMQSECHTDTTGFKFDADFCALLNQM